MHTEEDHIAIVYDDLRNNCCVLCRDEDRDRKEEAKKERREKRLTHGSSRLLSVDQRIQKEKKKILKRFKDRQWIKDSDSIITIIIDKWIGWILLLTARAIAFGCARKRCWSRYSTFFTVLLLEKWRGMIEKACEFVYSVVARRILLWLIFIDERQLFEYFSLPLCD